MIFCGGTGAKVPKLYNDSYTRALKVTKCPVCGKRVSISLGFTVKPHVPPKEKRA